MSVISVVLLHYALCVGEQICSPMLYDGFLTHQAMLMLVWRFAKFYWQGAKQECDITALVLVVIYRQALIWVSVSLCPCVHL